jgi:hypothetical protein
MAHPTTEQVRKAAEIAIQNALGVLPGEHLANIQDDNGEYIYEAGFKIRNQNGEFEVMTCDDDASDDEEYEKYHKFRVRVEAI